MTTRSVTPRTRTLGTLCAGGALLDVLFYGTLALGRRRQIWRPFLISVLILPVGILALVRYYYGRVSYVCPECGAIFRPAFREFFFAPHTPRTRTLTCSRCGQRNACLEIFEEG